MTNRSVIRHQATIHRPAEAVFEYVTTPANWPQWHPSSIRVTGADAGHSLEVDEQCTEEYVVAGRRGVALWTCRRRVAGRTWEIDATPERGATATVTYELTSTEGGTDFSRTLLYAMPNFALAVLNSLVIRRRIEAESALAVTRLKTVLETPV